MAVAGYRLLQNLFLVPTVSFDLLYVFVIVRLDRRDLVWINANRRTGSAGRASDNGGISLECGSALHDCVYGAVATRRLRAMGIFGTSPIRPCGAWSAQETIFLATDRLPSCETAHASGARSQV